jgi:hypothetical protein
VLADFFYKKYNFRLKHFDENKPNQSKKTENVGFILGSKSIRASLKINYRAQELD